jgi:hypothetical protein
MAHIWFRDEEGIWSALPHDGRALDISAHPPRVLAEGFRLGIDTPAAVIRSGEENAPVWVLLAAPDGEVRVNGFAPVAGVHVLQDRDEIRATPAQTLFFSTETLARVEMFVAGDRAIFCGRCRQPIQDGELAVRCPGCGIWYHQTEQLPCWTYAPTCAYCPRPTALDAEYSWTPEA